METKAPAPLVLYSSSHGSTKRCAGWVADALGAEILPSSKANAQPSSLANRPAVIYGGWMNGGKIVGLKNMLSAFAASGLPRLIVFAVGIFEPTDARRNAIIKSNIPSALRERVSLHLVRGAMNKELLSWSEDVKLRFLRIKLESKKNLSPAERVLLDAISHPTDFTSPKAMLPITAEARQLINAN